MKNFSRRILFLDHDHMTLVLFRSLDINTENNIWNQHWIATYFIYWSGLSQMFFIIAVVKFRKFHRKTPKLKSLFKKVFINFIKKTLYRRCFSMNFEDLRKVFSTEHLRWLLLHVMLSVSVGYIQTNSFLYLIKNVSINSFCFLRVGPYNFIFFCLWIKFKHIYEINQHWIGN